MTRSRQIWWTWKLFQSFARARISACRSSACGISDGRGELSKFEDWTEYLHVVDENLAKAVDLFFEFALSGALKRKLS